MTHIPFEAIPYFEAIIYLPMVLAIFEKDCKAFEQGDFKLKRPYIELVHEAKRLVKQDLSEAKAYLKKRHMKIVRGNRDELFSEYVFFHEMLEEHRRYSNIRLRNRVEELLSLYLSNARITLLQKGTC